MKERPILFSAPMVRAILDGRKTQTRRVVKDVPAWCTEWGYTAFTPKGSISARGQYEDNVGEKFFRLKYGARGDRLWVKETHLLDPPDDGTWGYCAYTDGKIHNRSEIPHRFRNPHHVLYRATWQGQDNLRWMPSIHMPRWASRITLEITGVRVERLQEIDDRDAAKEGVGLLLADDMPKHSRAITEAMKESRAAAFRVLWESINGTESWAANPWVRVIEFRKLPPEPPAHNG
jgi:hypothetical protein